MLTDLELRRQLMHAAVGLLLVLLVYLDVLSELALFLLIIVGFLASFICKRVELPFFSAMLRFFEREDQRQSFPGKGMLFLFIGSLLALELFDRNIALAATTILALGDSLSHIFGARFGKIKNIFNGDGRKLLEGTIVGAVAGFLGAWLFVPFSWAFLASFGAMIAEVVKIDLNDTTLDDNLVVPLVAGVIMVLMKTYL